ncbi:hypothetical protein CTEN210_02309 [Chaetoceros tenuissimus]|uniref:ABC transporter domain-containing protein n=1 Tax=Chaetoceros tenuissimus TaxID=426638 RepID=A0AAD3CIP4_9STRA|nr:hypothetical protein CTEN210_02309 [Chaetoceros tenuissimus]
MSIESPPSLDEIQEEVNDVIDLGDESNPRPMVASFRQHMYWTLYKNWILLSRRPIIVTIMILSSAITTLLAWPSGRDQADKDLPIYDKCGSVSKDYLANLTWQEKDKLSIGLNDSWINGLPVLIMSFGPFIHAVCSYLILRIEIESKLLGVLRSLGVKDFVHNMSWIIPLAITSFLNSLLAAITAQFLPVHVFRSVYFGGIFGSFFFLNLALVGASFFLSALFGANRKLIIVAVLLMGSSTFVPFAINQEWFLSIYAYNNSWNKSNSLGLAWANMNTSYLEDNWSYYYPQENNTLTTCDSPILTEEEGTRFKTEAQRSQVSVDEIFSGCFVNPSFASKFYHSSALTPLLAIPYFHFFTVYSNFIGYTMMPDHRFGPKESSQSPEDLALKFIALNESHRTTTPFPSGSTLLLKSYYDWEEREKFAKENFVDPFSVNVCPINFIEGFNFCGYDDCDYAKGSKALTGTPSVHDTFGYLLLLSLLYVILASYISQVVTCGNGASRKFYFFLDPAYWCKSQPVADGSQTSIVVKNLSKKYGKVNAVKDLSLELKKGRIISLLGVNGAGKSTLSSILSCELNASGGEASIFGFDTRRHQFDVRCLIGLCKQDDFLYPDLSAKEHLDIFAGLRGVDTESHGSIVQKWLTSVDLINDQHKFSKDFSGGMKRRLSVALSTVGDRPFIILDEPTTGMDPVSRRFVWQHLDEIKKDCTILLTTHAMEEADLLSDEVAIMKSGQLAAFGTPLELKTSFGDSAIQFNILFEKEDIDFVQERTLGIFQDFHDYISIRKSDAGSITLSVRAIRDNDNNEGVPAKLLTELVRWLESEESRVCEYGFSNSSLEEVFLNIVREDGGDNISSEVIDTSGNQAIDEGQAIVESDFDAYTYKANISFWNQVEAYFRFMLLRKWWGKRAIPESFFFTIMIVGVLVLGFGLHDIGAIASLQAVPVLCLSLMFLGVIFPIYLDKCTGQFHFIMEHGFMFKSFAFAIGIYSFTVHFIYSSILLTLYYTSPAFRETEFCEEEEYRNCYDYYDYITGEYEENCYEYDSYDQDCSWNPYFGGPFRSTYDTISFFDERVTFTPGGFGSIFTIIMAFSFSMTAAVFAASNIPGKYKFAMVIIGFVTIVCCLLPLGYVALSYFRTNRDYYYYNDDSDYEEPFAHCMKSIDPKGFYTNGFCSITNETLSEKEKLNCIGLELMLSNSNDYAFDTMISFVSLCAPKVASILPQYGIFQLLLVALMKRIKIKNVVFDNSDYCSGTTTQVCEIPFMQDLFRAHGSYLVLGIVILNAVGIPLFYMVWSPTPRKSKIEDQETTCNENIRDEVVEESKKIEEILRPILSRNNHDVSAAEAGLVDYSRIDYTIMKEKAETLPPILMHKLRKVYPSSNKTPPKVAVDDLNLQVQKGEILGLLGKNGSGKSTTLKILACNHTSTSGIALVKGHDVNRETLRVFENLGNCPQHDKIWEKLTVREHLEYFSRMKGIARKQVKAAALHLAKAVGLGQNDVYNRYAGNLSGGMRRRLSIAISLIGAPSTLLLDEPTTGLDPSTRNEIWNLITSFAQEERSIIITTHMMIEADTLCNRIAIIANGKLQVVASQQSLKDNYGSGYILQLNLVKSSEEYQEKAISFVREKLHPDASLDLKQAKTLHIHLPRDVDLEKVFSALYSPERVSEGCINQFLLSQSSLEDVFIALG